jgi:chorismate-pyruvate lyase
MASVISEAPPARQAIDPGAADGDRLAERHFTMLDAATPQLQRIEIGALDHALRCLLFTDGTVTRTLEAQTLSAVAVEVVEQAPAQLSAQDASYLDASDQTDCLRRRVTMSAGGRTPLAWAESLILPARLPERFLGVLQGTPRGIGGSIELLRLESRRELLWFRLGGLPAWAGTPGPPTPAVIRL